MPDLNTCVLNSVAGRIVDLCIQAVRSSTEGGDIWSYIRSMISFRSFVWSRAINTLTSTLFINSMDSNRVFECPVCGLRMTWLQLHTMLFRQHYRRHFETLASTQAIKGDRLSESSVEKTKTTTTELSKTPKTYRPECLNELQPPQLNAW